MFDFVRKPLLWQAWNSGLGKEIGDNVLYAWGWVDPNLIELRHAVQVVSLLVGGRKFEGRCRSRQEGDQDVTGSVAP